LANSAELGGIYDCNAAEFGDNTSRFRPASLPVGSAAEGSGSPATAGKKEK
jgi:hypothetical protein